MLDKIKIFLNKDIRTAGITAAVFIFILTLGFSFLKAVISYYLAIFSGMIWTLFILNFLLPDEEKNRKFSFLFLSWLIHLAAYHIFFFKIQCLFCPFVGGFSGTLLFLVLIKFFRKTNIEFPAILKTSVFIAFAVMLLPAIAYFLDDFRYYLLASLLSAFFWQILMSVKLKNLKEKNISTENDVSYV